MNVDSFSSDTTRELLHHWFGRDHLVHVRESVAPVGGVFAEVKASFSNFSGDDYKLVSRINSFRNDYIAHQNKKLTDAAMATGALGEWVYGLCRIWRFYG
ncbi:MAG: hypothetical protein WBW41_11245 [Verrucomicrobiia bacterium]